MVSAPRESKFHSILNIILRLFAPGLKFCAYRRLVSRLLVELAGGFTAYYSEV